MGEFSSSSCVESDLDGTAAAERRARRAARPGAKNGLVGPAFLDGEGNEGASLRTGGLAGRAIKGLPINPRAFEGGDRGDGFFGLEEALAGGEEEEGTQNPDTGALELAVLAGESESQAEAMEEREVASEASSGESSGVAGNGGM
jgi:hypothetical protein